MLFLKLTCFDPVAIDDFGEDEVVFSIPRSAVLNITTALPGIAPGGAQQAILSMPSWLVSWSLKFIGVRPLTHSTGPHSSYDIRRC
jgi:hypothetical protein